MATNCRQYTPERVEDICGIPRSQTERAAQMLWAARPVAYYAWSGVEMQSSSTQIARAIAQLYALTGCLDARGGNVLFAAAPSANVAGEDLLTAAQRARNMPRPWDRERPRPTERRRPKASWLSLG